MHTHMLCYAASSPLPLIPFMANFVATDDQPWLPWIVYTNT